MGVDQLSIISMNPSRPGMLSMGPKGRGSYLAQILEGAEPDICLLPGDDTEIQNNVVISYSQYMVPGNNKTVMLYDFGKIKVSAPPVSFSTFGHLQGLDFTKLVCPTVSIMAPAPVSTVVREFSLLTWRYDLFEGSSCDQKKTTVESLITFSHRMSQTTGLPILTAGDMGISWRIVEDIVKKLNNDQNTEFLKHAHADLEQHKFLPSMTKGATRSDRHKFLLKVYTCKSKGQQTADITDCFIASKELEMAEAKLVDLKKVSDKTGKQIKLKCLHEHRPCHTSMEIPVRPPRHHGG